METDTRDRVANPSSNFPQSPEEAYRAMHAATCRWMSGVVTETSPTSSMSPLYRRTNDAGFGLVRTSEQTKWLNDAVDTIRTQLSATVVTIRP